MLDQAGQVRERLSWPFHLPAKEQWAAFVPGTDVHGTQGPFAVQDCVVAAWRFCGTTAVDHPGTPQTLVSAFQDGDSLACFWIGLTGPSQQVTIMMAPTPGRSPHYWFGPKLGSGQQVDLQLAVHQHMGPGGILWRDQHHHQWSSCLSASPWGTERLTWPRNWTAGHGPRGEGGQVFAGQRLSITYCLV